MNPSSQQQPENSSPIPSPIPTGLQVLMNAAAESLLARDGIRWYKIDLETRPDGSISWTLTAGNSPSSQT